MGSAPAARHSPYVPWVPGSAPFLCVQWDTLRVLVTDTGGNGSPGNRCLQHKYAVIQDAGQQWCLFVQWGMMITLLPYAGYFNDGHWWL